MMPTCTTPTTAPHLSQRNSTLGSSTTATTRGTIHTSDPMKYKGHQAGEFIAELAIHATNHA
jgi:hypothetical protein